MNIEEEISKQDFYLSEFKFEKGDILRGVKIEYGTFGTPLYDEKGRINNAIIYCHGSGGNYASVKRINEICGKGKPIDTEKFYIISLSALGSPGSSAPSTTGLGKNFPQYTLNDMVNIQKQFLYEKFKIKHVKGIIGNSMGGFEVLTWATQYPDYMDFTIALATGYKNAGHNYILSKLEKDILEACNDFNNDMEREKTLKLLAKAIYSYGQTKAYYRELSNDEISNEMEEFAEECLLDDPNDLLHRNIAISDYDIEKDLENLNSKLLIIGIEGDEYFPPELDAIPLNKIVKNSKLLIINSLHGHLGSSELGQFSDEISEFLKEFKD